MKRIFTICCIALAWLELNAQNNTLDDFALARNQKIDAIMAPVQDIEARYWAYRITEVKDVTMDDLEKFSQQWLGSEQANKKLIAAIKKYVQSGKAVSVTPQERAQLDKANAQVDRFLNSPLADIKAQRDQKIDAIMAPVQDIEARYWAYRITEVKDTTLHELETLSKQWLGSEQANKKLIAAIKKYVQSGKAVSITPQERAQLDKANAQVRAFLNNGKENPAAVALAHKNRQIREIREPVFELEARYWAYRIAKEKDVTFEQLKQNSQHWVGEGAYNQKLINKIEENLRTKNTKKLTKNEEKLLEQTNQRVRQLLNQ